MTHYDGPGRDTPMWRVIAALLVMAALAVGLAVVARQPETSAASPTTPPAPVATSLDPHPTTSSAAVSPPNQEVLAGARAALGAWGEFAATGRLEVVDDTFWPDGPQRSQLATEATAIRANPLGPPFYEFVLTDAVVVADGADVARVDGTVTVSRPGVATATYDWSLEMRRDPLSGTWRLWTVTPSGG